MSEGLELPQTDTAEIAGLDRRQFLVAGGVAAAAVAAVTAVRAVPAGASIASMPAAKKKGDDLATAEFAAGLEVLAVATYRAALDAAVGGKLGAVPAAGATFVQTALAQHQQHLDRWNQVLTGAGRMAVSTPNAKLKATVDQRFAGVKDFAGAAQLARDLERIAAATYLKAIPALRSSDAIGLAGSIQVIDMQHVAILNFVLGDYPVPDVFAKTDGAAS